ncbi:MAG: DUF5658 family protein [Candidatus Syntrophosphaera sp.]
MLASILEPLRGIATGIPLLVVLFAIFILLNVLDGHSTWKVLRPHHYRRERNPVARWIFRKFGLPRGIVVFKVVLLGILTAAIAVYASYETFLLNIILCVADIVFLIVVLHNYRVSRRLEQRKPVNKEVI